MAEATVGKEAKRRWRRRRAQQRKAGDEPRSGGRGGWERRALGAERLDLEGRWKAVGGSGSSDRRAGRKAAKTVGSARAEPAGEAVVWRADGICAKVGTDDEEKVKARAVAVATTVMRRAREARKEDRTRT